MATPALDTAIDVRPGGFADLDAVMVVMDAAFGQSFGEAWTRSQCAGILPMTGVILRLATDLRTDDVIGFSLSRAVAGEAELLLLAVLPSRHRQGVGGRLLKDFTDQARQRGASRVHLEVRDGNPAASMYRNSGFHAVGRRRNYYHAPDGSRFDALTLAQNL